MAENGGNGEKYWTRTIIPILCGILVALVGTIWGITSKDISIRVKELERKQQASEIRMERIEARFDNLEYKIDLLLKDRGIKATDMESR